MLSLTEVLMACSLLSITNSCPKLDSNFGPNESFLGRWLSSWGDCFEEEEEEQKENFKTKTY